jgi:hypothetical protein
VSIHAIFQTQSDRPVLTVRVEWAQKLLVCTIFIYLAQTQSTSRGRIRALKAYPPRNRDAAHLLQPKKLIEEFVF